MCVVECVVIKKKKDQQRQLSPMNKRTKKDEIMMNKEALKDLLPAQIN